MALQAHRFDEANLNGESPIVPHNQSMSLDTNTGGSILENFEIVPDVGTIFYGFDHSTGMFINKSTETEEEYESLTVILRNAKAYFEKFDAETQERIQVKKQPVASNGEKDPDYKLKADFYFSLAEDLPANPTPKDLENAPECKLQLNPTSTIRFKKFVKMLSAKQIPINGIYIKLVGSETIKSKQNFRYKRVEFEALDFNTKEPLGVKTF